MTESAALDTHPPLAGSQRTIVRRAVGISSLLVVLGALLVGCSLTSSDSGVPIDDTCAPQNGTPTTMVPRGLTSASVLGAFGEEPPPEPVEHPVEEVPVHPPGTSYIEGDHPYMSSEDAQSHPWTSGEETTYNGRPYIYVLLPQPHFQPASCTDVTPTPTSLTPSSTPATALGGTPPLYWRNGLRM